MDCFEFPSNISAVCRCGSGSFGDAFFDGLLSWEGSNVFCEGMGANTE
jgi:mevalonate pyrophosphate decarboxylase